MVIGWEWLCRVCFFTSCLLRYVHVWALVWKLRGIYCAQDTVNSPYPSLTTFICATICHDWNPPYSILVHHKAQDGIAAWNRCAGGELLYYCVVRSFHTCNHEPRVAVHTPSWQFVLYLILNLLYVYTRCSSSLLSDPMLPSQYCFLPSRNPFLRGLCRAPTSGPSTSWKTCSKRKRNGGWAARPASSPPSLWLRRPVMSLHAAHHQSRRRKVGLPRIHVHK